MRRPAPLPPAAAARARDDAHERKSADEAVSARESPIVSVDERFPLKDQPAHQPPSPIVIPLPAAVEVVEGARRAGEVVETVPEPAGSDAADGASAVAEDIGIRQVWSASRARRKALRAEMRRFTGRQRRRRLLWIGGAAAVLLLVLGTLGAAYSPLFALERVRVVGTAQLDVAAVEASLADQVGTPLPLVDESAVKAALVAFPLVESYALEARPPHELVVRIVERTPVGVIQTRAGYTLVDAAGVALSTTQAPAAGRPLLTVEGGTESATFDAVGRVMRSLPAAIAAQVTAVSATTPDDVTLTLGGSNAQVVWGSAEDSALKATTLQSIMASRPPASVSVYDVSTPDVIVVR